MAEITRRPMSAALRTADLPPDYLAFIKAGTPTPVTGGPVPTATAAEESSGSPPVPTPERTGAALEMVPSPEKSSSRTARPKTARERDEEAMHGPAMVALSVRIPASLSVALLRASTERRIQCLKPFRQQEIVSEALTHWLKKSGFLD